MGKKNEEIAIGLIDSSVSILGGSCCLCICANGWNVLKLREGHSEILRSVERVAQSAERGELSLERVGGCIERVGQSVERVAQIAKDIHEDRLVLAELIKPKL